MRPRLDVKQRVLSEKLQRELKATSAYVPGVVFATSIVWLWPPKSLDATRLIGLVSTNVQVRVHSIAHEPFNLLNISLNYHA